MSPEPSGLDRICAVVDTILDAVKKAPTESPGAAAKDVNDAFLAAAYGRAFRCMRSIRELAGRGEADDAFILTRALLTIVARSLCLVESDDPEERERRFDSARRSWAEEALHALDELEAAGFEPTDERERIERIVEATKGRGVPRLPSERKLLSQLGLRPYYARVYKLASDRVHYSIGSALGGFLPGGFPDRLTGAGGQVALELRDDEGAEEALALATIVYGQFLEKCEAVIPHGVTASARRELVEYLNATAIGEKTTE
jgi:Family of unknown function (DUF5677)